MDIKNRYTSGVVYHSDHETMKDTLEAAVKEGANLRGAYLREAYLEEANLRGAYLEGANLRGANLEGAYLRGAYLEEAYLRGANLQGANLEGANLQRANLEGANLQGANLQGANLEGAYLRGANLEGANLEGANLRRANLRRANLSWTCLDPDAQLPDLSDKEIIQAGLEIDGEWILGWRTRKSQNVGNTTYEPGIYTAPVFSVDTETSCHPGIYIAGKAWLKYNYPNAEIVRCRCRRIELLHAMYKWRCKTLEVIPG